MSSDSLISYYIDSATKVLRRSFFFQGVVEVREIIFVFLLQFAKQNVILNIFRNLQSLFFWNSGIIE